MNNLEPIQYKGSSFFPWMLFIIFAFPCILTGCYFIEIYNDQPLHGGKGAALVIFGFIFIVVFIFLIIFLLAALKNKPPLQLDDKGITYKGLKGQIGKTHLPWEAVIDANIDRAFGNNIRVIRIYLTDRFSSQFNSLSKSHRLLFGNSILIPVEFLAGDKLEICKKIHEFIHNKALQSDKVPATRSLCR